MFIDGVAGGPFRSHLRVHRSGRQYGAWKKLHLRIKEGRYTLSTQFGKRYRSAGFTTGATPPLPGFRLLGTDVRTSVLVHPGHPPNLDLLSIGCLNPNESAPGRRGHGFRGIAGARDRHDR